MKTKLALIKSLGGYLRSGAAAATVLLSCGLPLQASAAAFDSPVGTTWDVVMSGRHQGLAVMVFNADGTFSVDSILVPKPQLQPSSSSDNRGTGGDDSRTVTSTGDTNVVTLPAHTNIFGRTFIPRNTGDPATAVEPGEWGFDPQGRLVGFYTDVSAYSLCVTNVVLVNTPIGVITNLVIDCSRVTNAINFKGSVVPGKHLTLNVMTPDGHATFSGVPVSTNLPDLSGNYVGLEFDNPFGFNEFLTLSPGAFLNTYNVLGGSRITMGPGYIYQGTAFFSKSGKFALAAFINPPSGFTDNNTDLILRSVIGSMSKQKFTFSTAGLQEPSGEAENRIKFTGARVTVGPQ